MPATSAKNLILPSFELIVNGSPLAIAAETSVIRIGVDEDVNLPNMFTIEVTGLDNQQEIPWLDDPTLSAIGNPVEVKLGYTGELTTLLKGEITSLEPEFVIHRLPNLLIRGYDRRHRLQRGCKTRTFVQRKDSDIAARIASEAGLDAQVTDSEVTHEYVIQANQTDLAFLQQRARQIHYEVGIEDQTLIFRPVANAETEALTLTLQDGLLEFYPRLSSMAQVTEVTVWGWSPEDNDTIVAQAGVGAEVGSMAGENTGATLTENAFGSAIRQISDHPVMNRPEADQLAKAYFNRSILNLITAEGICRGRTDLRAGKVITIDGIGKRFSGQYYVTTTSHRYGPKGYFTHFTARRNAA
jgi:uncharacterized protein